MPNKYLTTVLIFAIVSHNLHMVRQYEALDEAVLDFSRLSDIFVEAAWNFEYHHPFVGSTWHKIYSHTNVTFGIVGANTFDKPLVGGISYLTVIGWDSHYLVCNINVAK